MRKPNWKSNRDMGVPLSGDVAFHSAWTVKANPHEPTSVGHYYWIADWWRANAESYDSHVNGLREHMEDRGEL